MVKDGRLFQNCLHATKAEAINSIGTHTEHQKELFSPMTQSLWARGFQNLSLGGGPGDPESSGI